MMGQHSKDNRKKYRKERRRRIKEKLYTKEFQDAEAKVPKEETTPAAFGGNEANHNNVNDYVSTDILYTSMVKYMACRQKYLKMKTCFNGMQQDEPMLAPDRHYRTIS